MMHHDVPESLYSFYLDNISTFDLDQLVEFPQDTTTSDFSSFPLSSTIMLTNDNFHYPIEEDTMQLPSLMDYSSMELDYFDPFLDAHHVVGIQGYPEDSSEGSFFPSQNLSSEGEYGWSPTPSMNSDLSSTQFQPSLILPQEGMEIDKSVVLSHMLEACGEALDQGHKAQAEEILRCISGKVSPVAEPLEFYLSQDMTNDQGDYLKHEANKNFEDAFRGLYQGTPHGKVAHFVANSAILEAIPQDCEVVHIVDFDMGQGVQWPPLIEAIALLKKTLKLTSIKWGEESYECISSPRNFEETKRQLYEYGGSCSLRIKVEEKEMEEVVVELKKMNKRGGRKDFLAFNCMVGLPHMGKERSRRHVMKFLNLIHSCGNRGIATFGDGGACEKLRNGLDFRSFFDGHLVHYKALLESINSGFLTYFTEARSAIQCLFVAPNISSLACLQKWEDMREGSKFQAEIGLEGCRLSKEILMEVKEILRGSEGSYEARIEGQNGNELVLLYKGIQLVRVSTWRN